MNIFKKQWNKLLHTLSETYRRFLYRRMIRKLK